MGYSKLLFLQDYCKSKFSDWRKKFGYGIIGVHLGKKVINGNEGRLYSIVFHVKRKIIKPKKPIPQYLEIDVPNKGVIRIKTDVIETGNFKFQAITVGDKAKHISSRSFGALGLLLVKNRQFYACSCMHVLGEPFLKKRKNAYYLDISKQVRTNSIFFDTTNSIQGFLEQGIFGDLDAAISRIPNPAKLNREIPGFGFHRGGIILNIRNYQNRKVVIIGANSGIIYDNIQRIDAVLRTKLFEVSVTLTDLICCRSKTMGGDSGSLALDLNTNKVIGIVTGADDVFTYIQPFWKILNHFNARLA